MWPHRQQPTRLPRPWDSPGKNTGVGCHFLLQCMKVKSESEVAQSCLTLSDPMDWSLPGSSVHGIFQARVLEWVAIAFSCLYKFLQIFEAIILKIIICTRNQLLLNIYLTILKPNSWNNNPLSQVTALTFICTFDEALDQATDFLHLFLPSGLCWGWYILSCCSQTFCFFLNIFL